jgi:uroporphyrinogen III methyltransferase/synthase
LSALPLSGKRFLITRPAHQASDFARLLRKQAAEVVSIPTIEIAAPRSWAELDGAIDELGSFDILILTSSNGVDAFFERIVNPEQTLAVIRGMLLVAVGPKTAAALKQRGLDADLVPGDHRAEGIIELLRDHGVAGSRILYPRAEIARPLLVEALRQAGGVVVAPVAYRTLMPQQNAAQIRSCLKQGDIAAICFTSSSTFVNLQAMLGDELRDLTRGVRFFSIGPQTSATIRSHGYRVDLEPQAWTVAALVAAMVDYYRLK